MNGAQELRPGVAFPRAGVPLPVLGGAAAVLALGLFLYLDAGRRALEAQREGVGGQLHAAAPPPPLVVPPAPAPVPVPVPAPVPVVRAAPVRAIVLRERAVTPPAPRALPPAPPPPLVGEEPLLPARAASGGGGGALVVDLTSGAGAAGAAAEGAGDDTARATLIRGRSALIPQGAIIAAVLETPLNSDRPGLARALVTQDVRGFDGTRVLIPRGSRLIGEFKGDASPGLRRILVTWSRLIRPDGAAIRIASPVADAMGGAGVAGAVSTHFGERFASAVLQSALTIGVNVASALPVGGSPIYVGLPGQAAAVGQQFAPSAARAPTIKVREGAEIAVLVARDLDFSGTPAAW